MKLPFLSTRNRRHVAAPWYFSAGTHGESLSLRSATFAFTLNVSFALSPVRTVVRQPCPIACTSLGTSPLGPRENPVPVAMPCVGEQTVVVTLSACLSPASGAACANATGDIARAAGTA
ncbi:hypothetical protein [Streptomyces sp. C]|uniref:hypothetical protein n=1 Tax=Streptomyces sp. C TaxID=253839 RepID=UPI0001DEFADF|nr:hypothetical protein [Streptomyces sp. C]EFL19832.1 predicted protein [Streptomyces sp. C]